MRSHIRITFLLIVLLQPLLHPRPSFAETDFTSKTYIKFFTDPRDDKYAPLYEYVEMESSDRKNGLWNVYLSGWWGHDFSTLQERDRSRDALTNAYIKISPYPDQRFLLDVGRHFVFEGVAAQRIDGVSTHWDLTPWNGFSLFGGSPVETEFDTRGGDTIYGGRIYQRLQHKAELGLSFFKETNNDARFQEKTGLDLWLMPINKMEIKGHSFYNNIAEGWGEHAYTLRVFPQRSLILTGLFSRTNYENTFTPSTLSVFQPDFLGAGETLTKRGGMIEYRFNDALTGVLDYNNYAYRIMGDAAYYGAKLASTTSFGLFSGISFHRMEGAIEKLRYSEVRMYAGEDVEHWKFSIDAIDHHYDQPFNGISNAYSVNGTVRYAISDALASSFSVDYGKTPDFVYNTTVLLGIVYSYKQGR